MQYFCHFSDVGITEVKILEEILASLEIDQYRRGMKDLNRDIEM